MRGASSSRPSWSSIHRLLPCLAFVGTAGIRGWDLERHTLGAIDAARRTRLIQQLIRTETTVTGKSLNKDEFVTCGGVRLGEVNFKTMESRFVPDFFSRAKLLDIDGITGGFNFQAAWTTGFIAGRAMAVSD